MWLEKLQVKGFRNLVEQTVEFDPRINIIFGANGAGKTNLLEAIAVLASGRSFRTIHDRDLLSFTAPHFRVAGKAANSQGKQWSARVYYSPSERKHYFLDKREIPKRSLFSGWLPVSILLLDDRRVVAGPPAQRRAFLDEAVGKLSHPYRWMLAEYRKILAQRNALLRRNRTDGEFEVWEKRLAELASELSSRRDEYWKLFSDQFARMSRRFLPADEISLEYVPNVPPSSAYLELLAESRKEDRKRGITHRGPHRDDFRILLNGRSLRSFGSYGQQRLTALALALAEAGTVLAAGHKPVYIMDDVAAELDDANTRLLFDLIRSKGQVFYAGARPPIVEKGRRFHVKEGTTRQV